MKLKNFLNENENRLSTPIQMGGYVIAVDKKMEPYICGTE